MFDQSKNTLAQQYLDIYHDGVLVYLIVC